MTAIQLGAHGCERHLKGKRITQHRNESHQELVEEQTDVSNMAVGNTTF